MSKSITINSNISEIPASIDFIREFLKEHKVDKKRSAQMVLAIEEILSKQIENAGENAKINISAGKSFNGLRVEISGPGKVFDIDDLKESIIFSDKTLCSDEETPEIILSLAEILFGSDISIRNNKGINRAVITVKKATLAPKIFAALVLAIAAGLLLNGHADLCDTYIRPFGTIFLNLVKFIVCPIVLFSIMAGIVSMKDIGKIGKIGGIAVVYYFLTTAVAITIGLFIGNLFKNEFPVIATTSLSYEVGEAVSPMDVIVNIFPSNFLTPITESNMLQVIIMAIILGFSVILAGEKAHGAISAINTLNIIFMKAMELILSLSPIGVFCLLTPVIAANGVTVIWSFAKVLLAAYLSFFIHALIVYTVCVATLGKMSPIRFFKEMMPAILFAFSSASSIGTLPLNMECTKKLDVPADISSFVLPLGATINMDGTAIYQGICAIFIASCYGIDLTFNQMITIVLTAILASIGTAGVPGASMVMLALVLTSVGLPVDGIALVAGVDRIFDMGRTSLNITGDASCAVIVTNLLGNSIKKGKTPGKTKS